MFIGIPVTTSRPVYSDCVSEGRVRLTRWVEAERVAPHDGGAPDKGVRPRPPPSAVAVRSSMRTGTQRSLAGVRVGSVPGAVTGVPTRPTTSMDIKVHQST